jgi:uncharacterized repeat protein (TIGR01451 family)
MKRYVSFLVVLVSLLLSVEASAKALVTIGMQAEKEVVLNNVTKKVSADDVVPGDVIFYTLRYSNTGDEVATSAVVDDPIPKGTTYLIGSAYGNDTDITFSVDGGKTFKKPTLLTYDVKMPDGKIERRSISPEKYTHIRWTVGVIPAHGSGQVGFQTRVK